MTSQATNSQDNPLAGFGPNEWIVEDMYQRYLADPSSVDPAWHDFFADYRPAGDTPAPAAGKAPAAAGANGVGTAPVPPAAAPAAAPPPRPPPRRTDGRRRPNRPRRQGDPAKDEAKPAAIKVPEGSRTAPIRGIAARIVSNMDASLQVPTATSVRAVPAKLDRRQPDRHQQPPGPRSRRQGQLHPPHRVRAGEGPRRAPGDEQLVLRAWTASRSR